jgi:hypothetical protein
VAFRRCGRTSLTTRAIRFARRRRKVEDDDRSSSESAGDDSSSDDSGSGSTDSMTDQKRRPAVDEIARDDPDLARELQLADQTNAIKYQVLHDCARADAGCGGFVGRVGRRGRSCRSARARRRTITPARGAPGSAARSPTAAVLRGGLVAEPLSRAGVGSGERHASGVGEQNSAERGTQ